ncbi:MAG: DUF4124 domain-containing protein [Gammaproteobacteria bacterium]|nr:DUF4124 domain-containing protein [Gammaproteobacteria bacterium]
MRSGHTVLVVGLLGMMLSGAAHARVFRCTDAAGKVSYSQIPCPAAQQVDEMRGMEGGKQQDRDLCRDAGDLATRAFGDMGRGMEPSDVIDQYGGIDYINAATLGVINFAASLRYNDRITPQRVGSLTFSRCRGGGFGELHPGDLPILEEASPVQPSEDAEQPTAEASVPGATMPAMDSVDRCAMYQQQMEDIDRRLRRGYDSDEGKLLREDRARYRARWGAECAN